MMSPQQKIERAGALIAGMGITGLACARFLRRQNLAFRVIDSRDEPPQLRVFREEFPDAEISAGGFDNRALE
jgi:UDP-N-acetylmuramoylalanine--D-glutamate ligase